ncbi:calcium-transporting ATPase 5, plasma membrane-type-like isoform X2 [Magnolia sinica]|uniref:calcium-transporting ATPase 5, plasma membrane-type-like isoform X2 n=1 Tax=Magnolia sinica TaxID=86752 RepID=UPI00265B5417|nr:calcium-transporting ATPase 5, plasma membrane-type-like isoform X2 [Magnolia sinica]
MSSPRELRTAASASSSPYREVRIPVRDDPHAECSSPDVFTIPPKNASIERLRRWRKATFALNATRRFRYTLNLKLEEREKLLCKIRTHSQVIRASILFQRAAPATNGGASEGQINGYGIGQERLTTISRDHNLSALEERGGVQGLAKLLKTNLEKGIGGDDSEIVCRKNAFGANTYPRKKARGFLGLKEGWYDGGSIAFAVLLVIAVTAISDYKQSLQFQILNEEKRNIRLQVIRGGRRVEISIFDIVVGDVVSLNIGDQVPADGILISGHSLEIDESSMTGESKIARKDQRAPFLMSGCKVADGYGTMLVTGVGINTEWGLLMSSISEDSNEETPLQVRLNGVATLIGIIGLTVAGFVLVVLLARYFTGRTKNSNGTIQFIAGKTSLGKAVDGAIKILTIAVTIVVVAVPEGLPLAVTLTLAYSMRKMMVDKALVRRLSACETMGSATTICSDKTGTLTMNQMTIVEAYVGGGRLNQSDNDELISSAVRSLLLEGISHNTTGNVFAPENGGAEEVTGSPTEKAILSWGVKLKMKFDEERSKTSVLHVFPFNSEKKRGGVALLVGGSEVHIHWKGAAEIILSSCTRWLDQDGSVHQMDEDKASYFKKAIKDMAELSLRCVAFAYRLYDMKDVPRDEEQREQWMLPEDDLIFLAIVGIKDPCRPGVKEAVQLCQGAGVKVRMVTGDNIQTAKAIALECGILKPNHEFTEPTVIEGRSFRDRTDADRDKIADKILVMGRSSPNDKLLLVKALRKKKHVVAVTGDGTNDAPALHEADIGLAMGIQGTEVAKESSDIIILDDNFASVVKVVRWGRSVYANIQKFIQFQLTVNVAALIINVVSAVSSGDVPLNAVQLLWVNLIMDTLGALALATEPPTDHLMHRNPVGWSEPLISNIMWRNLLLQALYQVVVLLTLNFGGTSILHLKHDNRDHAEKLKNTMIFNTFVLCQVFNEFNARKPDEINVFSGVRRNRFFMGIIAFTVILQVLIIEFLGKFMSTVRLNWKLWLVSIAIAFISWPLAIIGKFIPVPKKELGKFFLDYTTKCRNSCSRCCRGTSSRKELMTSHNPHMVFQNTIFWQSNHIDCSDPTSGMGTS